MSSALNYFKKVYKDVPNWVSVMHEYSPKMLEYYTTIRSEAFKSSELSDIEKDELIASFNAGRLYKRSMILHTQAGQNKGSKIENLIEYFLVAYVYKGLDPLKLSLEAVKAFLEKETKQNLTYSFSLNNLSEVVSQLLVWTTNYNQDFLMKVNQAMENGLNDEELKKVMLSTGLVSEANKKLGLFGMYITELDGVGAQNSFIMAKKAGVTDAQFADLGYIIMMTAGIPSWFELSDYLSVTEQERNEEK